MIYIYISCDAIHLWSFMTKKHLCKVRPWNQKSFIKATLLRDNSGRQSLNLHFWLVSKSSELVGWLISQFPWSQQSWFKTSQDLQVSDWDWWNMIYMQTCFTKMFIIRCFACTVVCILVMDCCRFGWRVAHRGPYSFLGPMFCCCDHISVVLALLQPNAEGNYIGNK